LTTPKLTHKQKRQKAAQLAAARRVTKRAVALSIALLRADALRQAFDEVAATFDATKAAERGDEVFEGTRSLTNTPVMRAEALGAVHLAALYAVAEKWLYWSFVDSRVDALLTQDHVQTLRRFRHAVFHAAEHDDPDFKALAKKHGIIEWSAKLASALRDYLRRYHADPAKYAVKYLEKNGW
jgi:hypothetical protein